MTPRLRLQPEALGLGMTSQRVRDRLIERLRGNGIGDERVLNAIRTVPRHLFVDEALATRAYEDTALPIGHGQTISQPWVVAKMTEALFANGTLNFTERLHLTAGIRQSWDRKEYEYLRHNPDYSDVQGPCNFFLQDPPVLAGPTDVGNQPNCLLFGVNGTTATFKKSQTDWRVALDYRFTDDLMAYGQVATGYRAGGFNARPYFPSQATAHTPETITSYEVGIKSDLFDNRLRLNVAAFAFDYNDIVLLSTYCADLPEGQRTPCLRPDNVGSAEVRGAELELLWVPTAGLSINLGLSVLDTEITEWDPVDELASAFPNTVRYDASGRELPNAPTFSGNLLASYQVPFGRYLLTPAVDVVHRGSTTGDIARENFREEYTLTGLRLALENGDTGRWRTQLWVRNLFDEQYYVSGQTGGNFTYTRINGMPRTWGVTFEYNLQ